MDISSILGSLVSSDSISGISSAAGVSEGEAKSVLTSALPGLLSGALAQSEGADTVSGFAGALTQHSADDTSDLKGFLSGVDLKDGAKIVGHLLGGKEADTVAAASAASGASEAGTRGVLSAAAPLLMSLLGQETQAQQSQNSGLNVTGIIGSLLGNVDTSSLLLGLLGGGNQAAAQQSAPNVQTLDEKPQQQSGGFLGGILGSLFGGKK